MGCGMHPNNKKHKMTQPMLNDRRRAGKTPKLGSAQYMIAAVLIRYCTAGIVWRTRQSTIYDLAHIYDIEHAESMARSDISR